MPIECYYFITLKIKLMDMAKQKAAEPAVSWAFLVSKFAVYEQLLLHPEQLISEFRNAAGQ